MANSAHKLLIGSTEAYSGKSATILGLAPYLKEKGLSIAYSKPVVTSSDRDKKQIIEDDIKFIGQTLELTPEKIGKPILHLNNKTISNSLSGETATEYSQSLQEYAQQTTADLILFEGPDNLWEGSLFGLSVGQMAEIIDGSILLVCRYHSLLCVDSLLAAKQYLGDRLIGAIVNDIPLKDLQSASKIKPYLEKQGISIFGMIPRNDLLRSVSVREIAKKLDAKVLCREDRLDLMAESLTIGAMNVNSALKYFRQRKNMVVVTGGDRTELQMAALETSTQCLILTGQVPPQPLILSRAEDLEIPVLSVNLDTLTTVEIVDSIFGKVGVREPIKVNCARELMKQYFDFEGFLTKLAIEIPVSAK